MLCETGRFPVEDDSHNLFFVKWMIENTSLLGGFLKEKCPRPI